MSPDLKLSRTTPCVALKAFMVYQKHYLVPLLRRRLIASALHDDIVFISPLKHASYERRHSYFVALLVGTIQLHWSITRDSQLRLDWRTALQKSRLNVFERGVIYRIKKLAYILSCRCNMPVENPTVQQACEKRERKYVNMFVQSPNYYDQERASALVDYPFLVFSIRPRGYKFKKAFNEWKSHCSLDWYRTMIDKYEMPPSFRCVWHR